MQLIHNQRQHNGHHKSHKDEQQVHHHRVFDQPQPVIGLEEKLKVPESDPLTAKKSFGGTVILKSHHNPDHWDIGKHQQLQHSRQTHGKHLEIALTVTKMTAPSILVRLGHYESPLVRKTKSSGMPA